MSATLVFPAAWIPERPGDELSGTIIARRARLHPKGDLPAYQVFDVETDAGTFALHAYSAALRLPMRACTVGERVTVTYTGCRSSRSGRTTGGTS
jgi:hypothetical protein